MLINDNGIILLCIYRMLLPFQSAFPYDFLLPACQTSMGMDEGWAETRSSTGLSGVWPGCHFSESSDRLWSFLPSVWLLPFPSVFYTVLPLFWSSLLLPWSSLHITLCSLEQSYYRNLINNKFQCSDRSIKCMIRRGHYGE